MLFHYLRSTNLAHWVSDLMGCVETLLLALYVCRSSTTDWIHQTVSNMVMITGSSQTVKDGCKMKKRSRVR